MSERALNAMVVLLWLLWQLWVGWLVGWWLVVGGWLLVVVVVVVVIVIVIVIVVVVVVVRTFSLYDVSVHATEQYAPNSGPGGGGQTWPCAYAQGPTSTQSKLHAA